MKTVFIQDTGYPDLLHRLKNPPQQVSFLWDMTLIASDLLWVAGPRKPSDYVKSVMHMFCDAVKTRMVSTISWWADWIDQMIHCTSLEQKQPTVVVLGAWIDYALHSRQRDFLQSVLDWWWLIMSEYDHHQKPTHWTFPQRNRLIAALSKCVFVPGAPDWSWSKYTIDYAVECMVPVFVVPWPITEQWSAMTNTYLARWVVSGLVDFWSMLDHFWWTTLIKVMRWNLSDTLSTQEQTLLWICRSVQSLEVICATTGRSMDKLLSIVWKLEFEWYLIQYAPWTYVTSDGIQTPMETT